GVRYDLIASMKAFTLFLAGSALAAVHAPGTLKSGPEVGGSVFAFEPHHVTGPDAGTNTCPVCKYGNTPAVQGLGNHEDQVTIGKIVKTLEKRAAKNPSGFKAFVIDVIEPKAQKQTAAVLRGIAKASGAKNVALAYVAKGDQSVGDYAINLDKKVKNTV